VRLMPELYDHLSKPFDAAAQMETELAEDLRAEVYGCGRPLTNLHGEYLILRYQHNYFRG
jgi:hypothetical protein